MLPEVIRVRVIHPFGPPVVTPLILSAACYETFQIRYALRRGWSAWLGNNGQSSHDVRSGSLRLHCHKRCSPLDHDSRPKSFRHPPRCPYAVREASACSVSSDVWYDALFSHLFWHMLDRRVALIFWQFIIIFSPYIIAGPIFIRGILISFYGLFQEQSQHWTSQHTATTAGLFLDVSVAGIIGSVFFTTTRTFIFLHKMARLRRCAVLPHKPSLPQPYSYYEYYGCPTL